MNCSPIASATPRSQLPRLLSQAANNCVVIDVETTGLDPVQERIIEIGAARIMDGAVCDTFHTIVNPERPLQPFITEFTGLTDAALSGADSCQHALDGLLAFMERTSSSGVDHRTTEHPVIVGHNVAFDVGFIEAELRRNGRSEQAEQWMRNTWLCTAEASRAIIPRERVGRYRLSNVAEYLHTAHRPSHRALDDVYATQEVLLGLLAEIS